MPSASLAPSKITKTTLSTLLSLYPHTIREVYKSKLLSKAASKTGKKPPAGKKPTTAAAAKDSENAIKKDLEEFLQLDKLRYEIIPTAVLGRIEAGVGLNAEDDGGDGERPRKRAKTGSKKSPSASKASGPFLEKEEIVQLMDWKLKHGSHRPALLGMIRSNPEPLVRSTTSLAFSQLQTAPSSSTNDDDDDDDGDDAFPATPLETLTGPLRGVGPATASLFLSIAPSSSSYSNRTPNSAAGNDMDINAAPFFSDELFYWLCAGRYPELEKGEGTGEGKAKAAPPVKIKYNMKEYRQLWEAVRELRGRVNGGWSVGDEEGEGEREERRNFSVLDVERVAFVIGHIDVSGYVDGGEGEVSA
ncbi:hypothetical protein FQN52_004419 [Onygenales sp. PD_12]|nr:hypothetical protein FQN52_004419 [Onygenales sp. PD_12]